MQRRKNPSFHALTYNFDHNPFTIEENTRRVLLPHRRRSVNPPSQDTITITIISNNENEPPETIKSPEENDLQRAPPLSLIEPCPEDFVCDGTEKELVQENPPQIENEEKIDQKAQDDSAIEFKSFMTSDEEEPSPKPCFLTMMKLMDIIIHSKVDELRSILRGINLNEGLSDEMTPLHYACYYGNPKIVLALLDARANPNVKRSFDRLTPLMAAAAAPDDYAIEAVECARIILLAGGHLNIAQPSGYTALILAVQTRKKEMVKLFLENDADTDHADMGGLSALDYAVHKKYDEIVEIFHQHLSPFSATGVITVHVEENVQEDTPTNN